MLCIMQLSDDVRFHRLSNAMSSWAMGADEHLLIITPTVKCTGINGQLIHLNSLIKAYKSAK
jgi:hypothetical protein